MNSQKMLVSAIIQHLWNKVTLNLPPQGVETAVFLQQSVGAPSKPKEVKLGFQMKWFKEH